MNQVFNFKGAQVRTVKIKSEPWFVAKDVCDILEISNPTDAMKRLDQDERSRFNLGRQGEVNVVNESGLYTLILGSRKREAKAFRKWVTSEVLPAIRKHGGYLTADKVEEALLNPDTIIQLATQLKQEREEKQKLAVELEQQQPLVAFAEICIQSDKSIRVRDFAHSLSSHGIKIGEKRLAVIPATSRLELHREKRYRTYTKGSRARIVRSCNRSKRKAQWRAVYVANNVCDC